MRCPECGGENPADFRFCGVCGAGLPAVCPRCGEATPPGFLFCGRCGWRLADLFLEAGGDQPEPRSEPALGPPSTAASDARRPVTVLFADLVGYSTLAEQVDPEDLQDLLGRVFSDLREEIEARGGTIEKFIGDAIMAVFGAPVAHEDDPLRAVEAAMAIIELPAAYSVPSAAALQLRIGINSGVVVSGGVGDGTQTGVLGDAVNVAARLQQLAGPGEVLVGSTVWRRVRDAFEFQEVGALQVKGRQQLVSTYRIIGRRERAARPDPPFVGRATELGLLDLLWTGAAKGSAHVVSLVGGAGVGKSRLLSEFHPSDAALDVRVSCHAGRAFGPFLDLIEGILGRHPADLEELRTLLGPLGLDELAVMLGTLMGVTEDLPVIGLRDEQKKQQVFGAVLRLVQSAAKGPVLVVFEDLDQSDQATLELLGFVLARLSGASLLVVLSHRPELAESVDWTIRAHHTGIQLEELSPAEGLALARGALGVEVMSAELEDLVSSRAEGNPFFIQELLLILRDLGALRVVGGLADLARAEWQIPDTIQGTVLARLDRLDPRQRGLLQHAAVIGRSFSTELLEAVTQDSGVGPAMQELARAQLVVPDGPGQWRFKHGLMQEVIYDALLHRQRRTFHRKVAEALENSAAGDPALLESLAEHFARAEVLDKAREYALAAGDSASERMGFVEARRRYETALRLWGEGDEEGRLALLVKLGYAALLSGAPMEARAKLAEAEAGWRALGNVAKAGAALAVLGRVFFFSGEVSRGTEVLLQAIDLLESHGPSADLVRAYVWTSIAWILVGDAARGAELAQRGLGMAEGLGMDAARSHLENSLGVFEVLSGEPSGAQRLRAALELAERSGDAEALGRAFLNLSMVLALLFENREGLEVCRRGRALMQTMGATSFEWVIAGQEATMAMEQGRFDHAEALAGEILGPQRPVVVVFGILFGGSALIGALIRQGRLEEARRALDEVLPLAWDVGATLFLLPILAWRAEVEAAEGNLVAARLTIEEILARLGDRPAALPALRVLVPALRLQVPGAEALMDSLRRFDRHPSFQAILAEARATMADDAALFAEAADRYAALELPAQEARCRFAAGQLDRAAELSARFGLAATVVQGP
jgi:adenylate cyclase